LQKEILSFFIMLKSLLTIGFCWVMLNNTHAQKAYFQQKVNTNIQATLDDKQHQLRGYITMDYTNNAPEELSFIYLHLWMNAFNDKKSAYAKQALKHNNTRFYFAAPKEMGGYRNLSFTVNDKKCGVEIEKDNPDIFKILLESPLKTGETIRISTPFTLQIPYAFSRGGHINQQYLMTQWFPKPAVYDREGWHIMPYLDQGEFYAEFGDYDVELTLPTEYVIGATGQLQSLKVTSDSTKALHFKAENVHDFAWFADKDFLVSKSEVTLKSGKKVEINTYYKEKHKNLWSKATDYMARALTFYSEHLGEYPHPQASAVMTDAGFAGGMEYPMITALSGTYDAKTLDITIAHEVGHNWFQGILATNERDHAWMDEGMNTFYEHRYEKQFYQNDTEGGDGIFRWFLRGSGYTLPLVLMANQGQKRLDQAATMTSDALTPLNYYLGVYEKPAFALNALQNRIGQPTTDSLIQDYFKAWQFKHPLPIDFQNHLKKYTDEDNIKAFNSNLDVFDSKNRISKKGKKPVLKWGIGVNNPDKSNIYWSPALGVNNYDGLMTGLVLHNGVLPEQKVEWSIAPLFALKSKALTGVAQVDYRIFTKKNHLFTIGTGLKRFSTYDEFNKKYLQYARISPSVKIDFWKRPISHFSQSVQLRQTFINEERAFKDSLQKISIKDKWSSSTEFCYFGKLQYVLAPMSFRLSVEKFNYSLFEKNQNFLKTTLELTQDFMYQEGFKVYSRLFVGGFPVNSGRNSGFGFTRGFLGLSGRGFADYRYDDFYLGRNERTGLFSQQIGADTEGGMKYALPEADALRIGYSNNFITALNLKSDLPIKFLKGVKPYFDIGYFSDTRPGGERISKQWLASGGVAMELGNYLGIYFPVYFSGKSDDPNSLRSIMMRRGGYLSRVSFSINIKELNPLRVLKRVVENPF
jgi:hypothetical protein